MFGDPVIIGTAHGTILALLAGYNFVDGANLFIYGCSSHYGTFPRIVKIIVEGLLPISDATKK